MNPASPLEILYQDDCLVAIDKPAGYLVHPADEPQAEDLVAMKILRDQIGQRVHPVHRLDRPTSGVLLFATDREVARAIHLGFSNYTIKKVYHAIVDGHPTEDLWTCQEALRKAKNKQLQAAKTEFKRLETGVKKGIPLSLVECTPHTGRYHQIRKHLLHHGFPIFGDYLYAGIERSDFLSDLFQTEQRMLLQAKSLSFLHPRTQKQVRIEARTHPLFPL